MKNKMLRSLSLLGVSLMMAVSLSAQEAKVKTIGDKEAKYKSEELKIKDKKEEAKYKGTVLKVKDEKEKGKVKGLVRPMQKSVMLRTEMKTGETQVRTKQHIESVSEPPVLPEPVAVQPVEEPTVTPTVAPTPKPKYAARKSMPHKRMAVRKRHAAPRYIVRTKIVRDTVRVPGPEVQVPVVTTNTVYVHDTVQLTRVDTVLKKETQNTYTGYRVPRGNFKKVKLRKDKNTGDVWMKRKKE